MRLLVLTVLGVITTIQGESQLLENFAIGNNKFAANVYRELLTSNSGNILVCPLSVETLLALVHAGAGGQTAQQIATGLHLPQNKNTIQEIFTELTPYLEGKEYYTLNSANKIYIKNGYQIRHQYKNIAVNVFKSEIQNINFRKKQQAAFEMNRWVEEKTNNKIKNLISPNVLSKSTSAILINAMYFHGKWVTKFDKHLTRRRDFYLLNRNIIQTDMMEKTAYFSYFENTHLDAKFLELPYLGEDITMTFVLPNKIDGLSALEERIDDVFAVPNYYTPNVHVVVPKFKIESTIEFKPILQSLGVTDMFEDYANLNEILLQQPMKINKALQKTFIEVEEEGTIAAAATYGGGIPLSADQPVVQQFIADHPFIFYIKIKNIVFFAGRYLYPN